MAKTRVGYEANPNGNLWLKDSTGFGQKMLAKMGWKEGQGLGRTEQGITEAIRVARKRDHRGVGCSRQWAEEGTAQMDAFSAVLADLNRQHDSQAQPEEAASADQPMGLEENSRRSRNRLHYAKFTRGKDLSRCSEQALLSIMGPRGVPQEKEKEEEAATEKKAKADESGVRHVQSSLSTAEYFAQKMEAMRARLKASASAPDLCEGREEKKEEEEEEEAFSARPSFQLGGDVSDDLEDGEISQQSPVVSAAPTAIETDDADDEKLERRRRKEERRRRRRERQNTEIEGCAQEEDCEDEEVASAENEKEERRRRKEERRRRRQERRAAAEAEEKVEEEEDDEGEESPKQKKIEREEEAVEASPSANDDEDTSKRKRKKRKNRKQSESEEETVPGKRKARPSSAMMTEEETASFAAENQEIMQYLEWSAFSTSNLDLVVGYKYLLPNVQHKWY